MKIMTIHSSQPHYQLWHHKTTIITKQYTVCIRHEYIHILWGAWSIQLLSKFQSSLFISWSFSSCLFLLDVLFFCWLLIAWCIDCKMNSEVIPYALIKASHLDVGTFFSPLVLDKTIKSDQDMNWLFFNTIGVLPLFRNTNTFNFTAICVIGFDISSVQVGVLEKLWH